MVLWSVQAQRYSASVGKNAKIGSNAVVVKPVPENSTMVGSAARMLSDSHDEQGNPIRNISEEIAQMAGIDGDSADQPNTLNESAKLSDTQKQQIRLAKAFGFNAYGLDPDSQDPVADAFSKMLNHIQQSEARLDELQAAMCKMDPNFCRKQYSKLSADDLDVLEK